MFSHWLRKLFPSSSRPAARPARPAARPALVGLEDRSVPATLTLLGTTLTFTGESAAADVVTMSTSGTTVTFTTADDVFTGALPAGFAKSNGNKTATGPAGAATAVQVNLQAAKANAFTLGPVASAFAPAISVGGGGGAASTFTTSAGGSIPVGSLYVDGFGAATTSAAITTNNFGVTNTGAVTLGASVSVISGALVVTATGNVAVNGNLSAKLGVVIDATGGDKSITVAAGKTLTSTTDGLVLRAGADVTAAGATLSAAFVNVNVDNGPALDAAAGGTLNLAGATVTAAGGLKAVGGGEDDTFTFTKYAANVTVNAGGQTAGDKLVLNGGGTNAVADTGGTFSLGGGTISDGGTAEATTLVAVTKASVADVAGPNTYTLATVGGVPAYQTAGRTVFLPAGLPQLALAGGAGTDRVFVTLLAGEGLPAGLITFDGADKAGDTVVLQGAGQTLNLFVSSATPGSGTATIGTGKLAFSNLSPVDVFGFGVVNLAVGDGGVKVDVAAGKNSFGDTDAVVVSPSAGGPAFEKVALFNNASVAIDTTTVTDGDDVVTVLGTGTLGGNGSLSINTGGGTAADQITVAGPVALAGDFALAGQNITTNATITAKNVTFAAVSTLLVTADVTATAGITATAGNALTASAPAALSAGTTITLAADTTGPADPAGGTVNLVGANLVAPGGATITTGAEADQVFVGKAAANITISAGGPSAETGDQVTIDGQGANAVAATGNTFFLGGGSITPGGAESVFLKNVINAAIAVTGTAGNDAVVLETKGGVATYTLNGLPRVYLPAGLGGVAFNTQGGADRLTVNLLAGEAFSTPVVSFDGGGAGNNGEGDLLVLAGADQALALSLDTATAGNGTATIAGKTLSFANLDPVDVTGMAAVTVTFTGPGVGIDVNAGADFATGLTAALRLTRTPGFPAFEAVALSNNTLVTIDTTAFAGADVVRVFGTGPAAAHKNQNLAILTGTEAGDVVNFDGVTAVTADLFVSTETAFVFGAATLRAGGFLTIQATGDLTNLGAVSADADLALTAGGAAFSNDSAAGGTLTLTAGTNLSSGRAAATGTVSLLAPAGGVTVTGPTASNAAGVVVSGFGPVAISGNVTASTTITVTSGPDAAADQSVTISGNATLAAGGNLTITSADGLDAGSAKLLSSANGTVILTIDNGSADATGATAMLVGPDVVSKNTATLAGGAFGDAFFLSKYTSAFSVDGKGGTDAVTLDGGPTNPDLTVNDTSSAQFAGGGPITFTNIERLAAILRTANLTVNGSAFNDALTLKANGTAPMYQLTVNGIAGGAVSIPAGLATFTFNGLAGNDAGVVKLAAGEAVPAGLVTINGGAGTDAAAVLGAGQTAVVTLSPVAGNTGRGRIDVDSGTGAKAVVFNNLEPLDVSGMTAVTLVFAGREDAVTLDAGTDFTRGGAIPAVRVSGTTRVAGVDLPFETVALWNNTRVTIDTTTDDGKDTVRVNATGDKAAHGNANLTITTGTNGDVTTVAGPVSLAGTFAVTTGTLNVTGNVDAGGNVTATTEAGLTNAATVVAGGDVTFAAGGDLAGKAAAAGGYATLTAGGNVTLTGATSAAVFDIRVTAGGGVTTAAGATLTAAGSLVVAAGGDITLAANVTAGSFIRVANADTAASQNIAAAGVSFNSATGSVQVLAGDDLDLTGASLTAAAAQTISLAADTGGTAADAAGATVTLLGTTFAGPTATVAGNADADAFLVEAGYGVAVSLDAAAGADVVRVSGTTISVSSRFLSGTGRQQLAYANAEVVRLDGAGVAANAATAVTFVDDGLLPRPEVADLRKTSATEFTLTAGTQPVVAPALVTFAAFGGTPPDCITFTFTAFGSPIPAGGATTDSASVAVVGTGTETAAFAATGAAGGTLTAAGGTITLTAAAGLDLDNFAKATLTYAGAADVLTLADGAPFCLPAAPAVRVSGTTGGGTVTTVALSRVGSTVVDTTTADGADVVTLAGVAAGAQLGNLSILTGAGADAVAVTGKVAVGGTLTISTAGGVNINGPVSAGGDITVSAGGAFGNAAAVNSATGKVTVAAGKDITIGANLTAAGAVALAAPDNAGSQNVFVAAGVAVGSSAGTLTIRAGDDVTISDGATLTGTAITITFDDGTADPGTGATFDARGANFAGPAAVTGGSDPDTFLVTGYTSPVNLDGGDPTAAPGDILEFDTEGLAVTATPNSFNTNGAPVTYVNIESVAVVNFGVLTVTGSDGDDRLTIDKTGDKFRYQFEGGTAVTRAFPFGFAFNGKAGSDALVVSFAGGSPIPEGGVAFDGGAGDDVGLCVLGTGTETAGYLSASATAGAVTVNGRPISFTGLEAAARVDITRMTVVTVGFGTAADAVTIANGTSVTDRANALALVVSGPAFVPVGVYNNASLTIDTTGVDGADTVAIASANNAHGNVNLVVVTGTGADAVTVTGPVAVTGNLSISSLNTTIDADAKAGGNVTLTNAGTLTLGQTTVTAGGTFQQVGAGNVALTTAKTATVAGAGGVAFAGTIDGPGGLVVNTANVTTFSGTIGGTTPVGALTTDGGGTTRVGGDVRAKGAVTFGDVVTYAKDAATFASSEGAVTFANTLDPAAAGLAATFSAGGNLTFNGDVGGAAAAGRLAITTAADVTFVGTLTAASLTQAAGTGNTSFNGVVTLSGNPGLAVTTGGNVTTRQAVVAQTGSVSVTTPADVSFQALTAAAGTVAVTNAKTATFGGVVNALSLTQTGGTGTTTFAAAATLTAAGGANVSTNAIVVNAPLTATAAGGTITFTAAAGATQSAAGAIVANSISLNGNGTFQLDAANNDVTSTDTLRINVGTGDVFFRDVNSLILNQRDNTPLITIGTGNLTLTVGGDFTAKDTRLNAAAGQYTTNLLEVGGAVQVFIPFAVSNFADGKGVPTRKVVFDAEAKANSITLGTQAPGVVGQSNEAKDTFTVRPSAFTPLFVNGNRPVVADGLSFSPFDTLVPQFTAVSAPSLTRDANGNGMYTFGGQFRDLVFTSIENLGGLGFEGFAVQTGPTAGKADVRAFAIRVFPAQNNAVVGTDANKTSTLPGGITGAGTFTNPFVVSPAGAVSDAAFSAPRIVFGLVNGDQTPDMIIASGSGDLPLITIVDGNRLLGQTVDFATLSNPANGFLLAQFFAYETAFLGGVNVAVGDLDGDGRPEIVTGTGVGGGQRVRVFRFDAAGGDVYNRVTQVLTFAGDGGKSADFFAFDDSPAFRGGVNVAVGDVNGDGKADIIVGAGVGGGPRVVVYDGFTGEQKQSFFAYEPTFRGGVLVDSDLFNDPMKAAILTAPGAGGGSRIRVFEADTAGVFQGVTDFFAFPQAPAAGALVPEDRADRLGVGGVAFGSSPDGTGRNRSILVSTPRGQRAQILRFNRDGTGMVDLLATPAFAAPLDPLAITPSPATLSDGGSVGGA